MLFAIVVKPRKHWEPTTANSHWAVKRYWRIMDLLLDISKRAEKIMDLLDFKLFKAGSTELLMELHI